MNRNRLLLIGGLVLVIVVALGAIWFFSAGDATPSGAISAPTLSLDEAGDEAASTASGDALTGRTLYRIDPEQSEVRFLLDEDLRGQRVTVIGATNEVAGDIIVDFDSPADSEMGVIRINARTLETDNEFRNRAIRGQILRTNSDENEFSEFTPTALSNLPDSVSVGETVEFQITGDLWVSGTTNEVTFDATVTVNADGTLSGFAAVEVLRGDYGLTIPDVPGVANVTEEVQLEIDFVAAAVDESEAGG